MAANLYNQYVWLVDTIRSAGRITKREIDQLWAKSSLNEKKEPAYPARSFHRHKEVIPELFGLYIGCENVNGSYVYYISNADDIRSAGYRSHILNNLAFTNQLLDSIDLQKRIFFEPITNGALHLSSIVTAMRDKVSVFLTFTSESGKMPVEVIPYCLKEKDAQWYLAAKNLEVKDSEAMVFSLAQVVSVRLGKTKASMPRWFHGEVFFNSYFGHIKQTDKVQKSTAKKEPVKKAPKANPDKKQAQPATPASQEAEQLTLF